MLLEVHLPEGSFLADVGFGRGLVLPLRMVEDEPQVQEEETYRLKSQGEKLLLQVNEAGEFRDLYLFDHEEHFPPDYEVANHYTSTHPRSRFVQGLFVARPTKDGRSSLRNRTLSLPGNEPRELAVEEIPDVLRRYCDLEIPRDARFRCFYDAAST